MFHYVWTMVLIVISNTLYQICAKSVPDKMNPFASLTLTYATATAFSAIMYFVLNRNGNLLHEYMKTNCAVSVWDCPCCIGGRLGVCL